MTKTRKWLLPTIIVLFSLALWVLLPIDSERFGRQGIQFGLDLEGGVRLIYQADLSQVEPGSENEVIDGVIAVIANRINPLGVTEPNIEKRGVNQIVVELPELSVTDIQKERIGRTALLEFREWVELPIEDKESIEGAESVESEEPAEGEISSQPETIGVWVPVKGIIDGEEKVLNSSYFISNTEVRRGQLGEIVLYFEFNKEGAQLFEQITEHLTSQPFPFNRLGIFEGQGEDSQALLGDDGQPIAPIVRTVLSNDGVIEGLSLNEASGLSSQLNAGRLPVPLINVGEMNISPTLGEDFVDFSIRAGIIGIALVMFFMILYYRILGILASLALVFYGAIVLALFKLIPVTLTLAGIGGFILSIGMAVDANVLIFERMKEEFRIGQTLGSAIESGFNRAWTAIKDSNITTFIVCLILYWVGGSIAFGGSVKGFALTLFIGVAVSMFSAIVVTRTLLRLFVGSKLAQRTALFTPYSRKK